MTSTTDKDIERLKGVREELSETRKASNQSSPESIAGSMVSDVPQDYLSRQLQLLKQQIKQQIQNPKTASNEQENSEDFRQHQEAIRHLIVSEYRQKHFFRNMATGLALCLILVFMLAVLGLIHYLVRCKGYVPSDAVMIGLCVTSFANVVGLVAIVFKYIFSDTKDLTAYSSTLKLTK